MESLLDKITADVYNEQEAIVLEWRIDNLMRAGYGPEAAFDLAFSKEVDLHKAVGLVKRGCPTDTALRILL
jgi:hypothetical protein